MHISQRLRGLTPLLLLPVLLVGACSDKGKEPAREPAPDRTVQANDGAVKATLTVSPGEADLTTDNLLTLTVEAPAAIDVSLPPLAERLTGLSMPSGSFDDPSATLDGTRTWRRHARLVPTLSEEYRIAPLIIRYSDNSTSPPRESWFTTPPLILPLRSLSDKPATSIETHLEYEWVRPGMHAILGYVALVLVAVALLVALIMGLRRFKRARQLARLSPRERALAELETLMHSGLLDKAHIKDFYVELTMVVRRYIERQHQVRAPEHTTEEFLQEISADARFPAHVATRLREFLQAADLVKFAAYQPGDSDVDGAVDTARTYIETDAAADAEAHQIDHGTRKGDA